MAASPNLTLLVLVLMQLSFACGCEVAAALIEIPTLPPHIPERNAGKGSARCRRWVGSLELVGLSAKACPSEDQSVVSKALVLRLWI